MSKDKTILFVMPRLPFPASSGRKNVIISLLQNSIRRIGLSFGGSSFFRERR